MTTTREAALEAALRKIEDYALAFPDMETVSDMATAALAARPAPQPAADTRVVSLEDLKNWRDRCAGALPKVADEIRAIIGNATPAQSDKIAEAARVVRPEAIDALAAYQQADMDGVMVLVSRQAIEECLPALRALAGKVE